MKTTIALWSCIFIALLLMPETEEIPPYIPMPKQESLLPLKTKEDKDFNVYVHAAASEEYKEGYDADGFPYRGYMSAKELSGAHVSSPDARVRFQNRLYKLKQDFVDTMSVKALEVCKNTLVPPSILVAQSIIETAHGTSRLKHKANNFFGHTFKSSDVNKRGIIGYIPATDKDKHGKSSMHKFRIYKSAWWSLKHHVWLLENNYAHRRKGKGPDREQWMAALCGCNSDMNYVDAKKARYLYAGACAWAAKDGVTCRYVSELRFIIKLYKLDKLDTTWKSTKI